MSADVIDITPSPDFTDEELDLLATLSCLHLKSLKDEGKPLQDTEVVEVWNLLVKLGITPNWDDPMCEASDENE